MREKKRFKDYQECAHVWASQTQKEGHTVENRMFFEGSSIYSYGHHFEIARIVASQKGKIVLFTDRDYSNTTSRHKYYVKRAIEHMTVVTAHSFDDHNANIDGYLDRINNALERVPRTYHINDLLSDIRSDINLAKSYLKFFGRFISKDHKLALRKIARKSPLIPNDLLEKLQAREAKNSERQAKAAATRAETRKKLSAERNAQWAEEQRKREEKERLYRENLPTDIERWKLGEKVDNYLIYDASVMLRISGNEIETSRNAYIPLIAARKFWRRFLANESRGAFSGMRLGHYTISTLSEDTLTVGCHDIPVTELRRLADVLGWSNGVPYDAAEVLQ